MIFIVIKYVISLIIASSIHIKLMYRELIIIIEILDSVELMISNIIISASYSITDQIESNFI